MVTQGEDGEMGCRLQLRQSVHKLLFARGCCIILGALSGVKEGKSVCGNC